MNWKRTIQRGAACAPRSAYRIGPVRVELSTTVPAVAAAYHALYAPFVEASAAWEDDATCQVQVFRQRSWRTGLAHYHIESDVEEAFTVRRLSRVLPHVEGAVNLCIARYMPRYLMLHAAALTRNGVGVLLPGGPGFGKTTLAAALTARGWQYASDEFAMIDPQQCTLEPYPKALSVKSGAVDLLKSFGVPVESAPVFDRADKGAIRLLPARAIRSDAIASPSPIRLVVFPTLGPDAPPCATPMTAAEAVFEMSRRCFNLLRFRSQAIDVLSNVVRGARCYRMRTGDLALSCQLLTRMADAARDSSEVSDPVARALSAA